MSKKEMLDLLRLLSALESWAMADKDKCLPDYLHEDISRLVTLLEGEILKEPKP